MHKATREKKITGTGGKDKTPVQGLLERGTRYKISRVHLSVLKGTKKAVV